MSEGSSRLSSIFLSPSSKVGVGGGQGRPRGVGGGEGRLQVSMLVSAVLVSIRLSLLLALSFSLLALSLSLIALLLLFLQEQQSRQSRSRRRQESPTKAASRTSTTLRFSWLVAPWSSETTRESHSLPNTCRARSGVEGCGGARVILWGGGILVGEQEVWAGRVAGCDWGLGRMCLDYQTFVLVGADSRTVSFTFTSMKCIVSTLA